MQVHPTPEAVHVVVVSVGGLAVGLVLQEPVILGWSGCLLFAVVLAHAATVLSVAQIRKSGLEMLWRSESRSQRVARNDQITLVAEIRNRHPRPVRFSHLRAIAASGLEVLLELERGQIPAGGRLHVPVRIEPLRVGLHGLHGLSLEVQGGPGLFEVPLTFANPYGFDVLPRPYAALAHSPRGGRSRTTVQSDRASPLSGESAELREIREHRPGDPFKRIAWKASARRGILLVRDYERDDRDVMWLVLDASVELWAGPPGTSALDVAIDEVASVAQRALSRGHQVGLAVVARRVLEQVPPGRGTLQAIDILAALARGTVTRDADRSGLDEADLAARVIEHLRPLGHPELGSLGPRHVAEIARHAEKALRRAPLVGPPPAAPTPRERALRHYLAAFGIDSPARLETDRAYTDQELVRVLERVVLDKKIRAVTYLWSPPPPPGTRPVIEAFFEHLPRRIRTAYWLGMHQDQSIHRTGSEIGEVVADAVALRTRIAQERGAAALRRLGVRVTRLSAARTG